MRRLVSVSILLLLLAPAQGAPFPTDDPTTFFTKVASRLLKSEFNLDLSRIQLYPTNQYTPEVHRVLQIAANLYDSTTNRPITGYPFLPSVFRPLFQNDAGVIYISDYREETGTNVWTAPMRDLADPADRAALTTSDMVCGIPLVIGAKKGFPNFNEFAMQTACSIARRLEFRRPIISSPVNETNQMYIVGISNLFAIEAWNSYTNAFPRELAIAVEVEIAAVISDQFGSLLTNRTIAQNITNIPVMTWAGYSAPASFQIPISNHFAFLPTSTYHEEGRAFIPKTNSFERHIGFPVPQWRLSMNVRLRFMLLDVTAKRILDYVNLCSSEPEVNISEKLREDADCGGINIYPASQWCTNRIQNASSISVPTYGILNQFSASSGSPMPTDWNSFYLDPTIGLDAQKAVDQFRVNVGLTPRYYPWGTYHKSNIFYAAFVPLRTIYQLTRWQANDPLVHSLLSDVQLDTQVNFFGSSHPLDNIARRNNRYEPWTRLLGGPARPTQYDPTLKDPLLARSDDWNFPNTQPPNLNWLGSVHRGTPWQSIYLKSAGVEPFRWQQWVGVTNAEQARRIEPTNDWRIASLLTSLFNTNDPHDLVSVNNENLSSWLPVLHEIAILTNTLSDADLSSNPFLPAQFEEVVMQSNSVQSAAIVTAISSARANRPNQQFRDLGEILGIPELTVASPWLNTSAAQRARAINDEAFERIPFQILGRLRSDSIGSIVQCGNIRQIQFSGFDGFAYAVHCSSNLVDWIAVSTNYAANGVFGLIEMQSTASSTRFYRSVLLP